MHRGAQRCPGLHTAAQGCTGLPRAAQGCTRLSSAVQDCPGLPRAAQGCAGLPRAAQGCPGLPRAAQGCARLLRAAQGCTRLRRAAQGCAWLPRGAQGCAGLRRAAQGCAGLPGAPIGGLGPSGEALGSKICIAISAQVIANLGAKVVVVGSPGLAQTCQGSGLQVPACWFERVANLGPAVSPHAASRNHAGARQLGVAGLRRSPSCLRPLRLSSACVWEAGAGFRAVCPWRGVFLRKGPARSRPRVARASAPATVASVTRDSARGGSEREGRERRRPRRAVRSYCLTFPGARHRRASWEMRPVFLSSRLAADVALAGQPSLGCVAHSLERGSGPVLVVVCKLSMCAKEQPFCSGRLLRRHLLPASK